MCHSSVTIKIFCTEHLNVANTLSKIIRIIIVIIRVKCRFVATRFACFFFSVRLSRFARMWNKPRKKFRKIRTMNRRFGWNTNLGLELEIEKVSKNCSKLKRKKKILKIIYHHISRTHSDEYFRSRVHKCARNSEKLAILGSERHQIFISKRKIYPFLQ